MERFSTVAALDMQGAIVAPVFDSIYAEIFGTTEARRPVELSGIQLAENLVPKRRKRNGKDDTDNHNH